RTEPLGFRNRLPPTRQEGGGLAAQGHQAGLREQFRQPFYPQSFQEAEEGATPGHHAEEEIGSAWRGVDGTARDRPGVTAGPARTAASARTVAGEGGRGNRTDGLQGH